VSVLRIGNFPQLKDTRNTIDPDISLLYQSVDPPVIDVDRGLDNIVKKIANQEKNKKNCLDKNRSV
jgi:hypothetical protein